MADSLREEIRACVREELQKIERTPEQITNQSLVERTRSLIQSSATSASQALARNETRNQSNPLASVTSMPRFSSNKRPAPGHPLRFSGKKTKQKSSKTGTPQIIPKTVYLIDNSQDESDYSLTESMILVKGECDLKSTDSEDEIRSELTNLFKVKLPLITKKDFDFVRRERNTITTPIVKAEHKWDFKHVKQLCGQGKLYVRLNVIKDILDDHENAEDSDDITEIEGIHEDVAANVNAQNVNISPPAVHIIDDQEASTSAGHSFFDESLANLRMVFPEEDVDVVRETLMRYEDADIAAQALSDKAEASMSEVEGSDETVAEVLQRLRKQMQNEGSAEKLKVDEEDLAVDFFQHYKSCTFDPKVPIRIQIRGQPAIDSGGVLRQAFSTAFTLLSGNDFLGLRLFTGPSCRLTPVYSSECILTGVFEIIGGMISHSMVQSGPGFPYFAPAVYSYIATGNLEEAVTRVSVVDIADLDLVEFVTKVRDAPPTMLDEVISVIAKEPSFIYLMQECGDCRRLTVQNRLDVMQTLILHATIVKHKAALDQLRKGLSNLGLLDEIQKNPDKFKMFFLHEEEDISSSYVKGLLKIEEASIGKPQVEMLFNYIEHASKENLAALLAFLTGSRSGIGSFSNGCIKVSVENIQGFFASTCILLFHLPSTITNYEMFASSLSAVLKGRKFTTI